MTETDDKNLISDPTGVPARRPSEDRFPARVESVCASMHADLLRFSNPVWRARVANGVDWMLWGGAGMLVFAVLAHLPSIQAVIPALDFIGQLAECYGLWLCTTPEPFRLEAGSTVRRVARGAALASLVLQLLGWWLPAGPLSAFVGECCGWCAGSVAGLVVLVLLARLAARLPSKGLTERIVTFAWFYAVGLGVIAAQLLAQWVCYLLGAQSLLAGRLLQDALSSAVVLGPVLFIGRLIVLFTVSRAFAAAAEESREADQVEQGGEEVR